jgi:hypothetical protein
VAGELLLTIALSKAVRKPALNSPGIATCHFPSTSPETFSTHPSSVRRHCGLISHRNAPAEGVWEAAAGLRDGIVAAAIMAYDLDRKWRNDAHES